jgi:hypothetical protein
MPAESKDTPSRLEPLEWNEEQSLTHTSPSTAQLGLAVGYLLVPTVVLTWAWLAGYPSFFETRTLLGLGLLGALGVDTFWQAYLSAAATWVFPGSA